LFDDDGLDGHIAVWGAGGGLNLADLVDHFQAFDDLAEYGIAIAIG